MCGAPVKLRGGLEGARGRRRQENGAAEVLTGGAGGLGVAELWRARVYGGAATEWGMRCGGPRAVFIGRRSALGMRAQDGSPA